MDEFTDSKSIATAVNDPLTVTDSGRSAAKIGMHVSHVLKMCKKMDKKFCRHHRVHYALFLVSQIWRRKSFSVLL